jgi:hypothetical protein
VTLQDHRAVAVEGEAGDVGGHEGVAVPVAADPGAEAEEGRDPQAGAGPGGLEARRELAVHRRDRVEQRALEDEQPGADLVVGGGARGAVVAGGDERRRHLAQPLLRGRAVGGSRPRVGERLERGGRLGDVVEDGSPPRLGGVGGEHRHDEHPVEERLDLGGAPPGGGHAGHRRRDRPLDRRRPVAVPGPQRPQPLDLLGCVHEVEEDRVRLGEEREVVDRETGEAGGEGVPSPGQLAAPQRDGGPPRGLDELQRPGAPQLRDGLAEDAAQAPDVLQQPLVIPLRHGPPPRWNGL